MLLILIMLAQAEATLPIDAFLKGDAAARAEIVKAGAHAVLPLRAARDKAPEQIDALLFDVKKAAAYPKGTDVFKALEESMTAKGTVVISDDPNAMLFTWGRAGSPPIPLYIAKFDLTRLKATRASIELNDQPVREYLTQLCNQTGLDYAIYHNAVILGWPESLWPAAKKSARFGPSRAVSQKLLPDDEAVLKRMREGRFSTIRLEDMTMSGLADILLTGKDLPFLVKAGHGEVRIPSININDLSVLDVVSMITQMAGLDFTLEKGEVVIDASEPK